MKYTLIVAAMLAGHSALTFAQTERDLASHEHGAAALNIAIEESGVFLELDTPWMNLVGFEHSPSTPEQQTVVDEALATLAQPQQLFLFTGGVCTIVTSEVDSTLDSDEHDEESHDEASHDEASHDEDSHDEDSHDEDSHDEDSHDEDSHDEDSHENGETHSGVSATYEYSCPEAARLEEINLSLFEIWPGIEHLEIQLIGPGGQALVELNPASSTLDLRQVQ